MNRKLCAPADKAQSWESIDWKKAEAYVKKLQMRIVKAQKGGHYNKVKSLQWLLTHSFYAKALAVKRVTSNKGKNTAGVDHELWKTPKGKFEAIDKLKRRGYQPQPLRRVYIPKKNGKLRPLCIPSPARGTGAYLSPSFHLQPRSAPPCDCSDLNTGILYMDGAEKKTCGLHKCEPIQLLFPGRTADPLHSGIVFLAVDGDDNICRGCKYPVLP